MKYMISYKRNGRIITTEYHTIFYREYSLDDLRTETKRKSIFDAHIVYKCVSEEEAKKMYCQCKEVFILDGNNKMHQIPSAWDYGSHASDEELFYRGIHSITWTYCHGKGRAIEGFYVSD